ncbi:molybdopterin cofactor-binding domain-containing protein [Streptomyces muensis]|uniref:Molybdopterin-dependent oxidoreductase n=1 Tax=Streptomyces muensis TaxID=1077944 RepID=A0A9X1TGX9_STRM4|nr:molybdopterin cofactor-binding domain-containing protein [Streptomyces muensis]MCF1592091.1 molybdopterin-dependent oxidoreductase [Streptomyces muensis]
MERLQGPPDRDLRRTPPAPDNACRHDRGGAYARYEPLGGAIWTQVANACYQLKHLKVRYRTVYTNKGPVHPNRGYSRLQHMWVVERMMDIAAHKLGLDPVEFRSSALHSYLSKGPDVSVSLSDWHAVSPAP